MVFKSGKKTAICLVIPQIKTSLHPPVEFWNSTSIGFDFIWIWPLQKFGVFYGHCALVVNRLLYVANMRPFIRSLVWYWNKKLYFLDFLKIKKSTAYLKMRREIDSLEKFWPWEMTLVSQTLSWWVGVWVGWWAVDETILRTADRRQKTWKRN